MKMMFLLMLALYFMAIQAASPQKNAIERQLLATLKSPVPEDVDSYIEKQTKIAHEAQSQIKIKRSQEQLKLSGSALKAVAAFTDLKHERAYQISLKSCLAKQNAEFSKRPNPKIADNLIDSEIGHQKSAAIKAYSSNFDLYLSAEEAFWALNALKSARAHTAQLESELAPSRAAPGGPNPDQ
jgi:hypothetical protein